MMGTYKVLNKQRFEKGKYAIVPIRMEDRHIIRKWRNEQIYHLRQDKVISKKDQDTYFNTEINKLFAQEKPIQILFSYLENNICIGYGGLVHINWKDKNAEISFLTKTDLNAESYEISMINFMDLIAQLAFKELNFHKLFTYAFDVRPEIYHILEKCGFRREATLKEHCHFDGDFVDVVIHAMFKSEIKTR